MSKLTDHLGQQIDALIEENRRLQAEADGWRDGMHATNDTLAALIASTDAEIGRLRTRAEVAEAEAATHRELLAGSWHKRMAAQAEAIERLEAEVEMLRITSDLYTADPLPWEAMERERVRAERAEAKLDRVAAERDTWKSAATQHQTRALRLRAALDRARALVGEWREVVEINGVGGPPRQSGASIALMNCADELAAVLDSEGGEDD